MACPGHRKTGERFVQMPTAPMNRAVHRRKTGLPGTVAKGRARGAGRRLTSTGGSSVALWLHTWPCQVRCLYIEDVHDLLDLRSACCAVS